MGDDGYDPGRSRINDDKLADFLRSPITGDICDVPGIGPAAAKHLADEELGSVTNTYQLIGKFLQLKGDDIGVKEHCDLMWQWLQAKGINSYRSGIVLCVAEKTNTMLPGIYDASEFAE